MSEPKQPEKQSVEVSVLVDGEHLAKIDAVTAALEDAGLRLDEVMGSVGVITGTADDPDRLVAFEALDGVDSVEVGRTVHLPPPDAPIQ
ncbi:MAG: hypothetical protein ACR2ML_01115 [Solirubrobacteraceae bacterium]